MWKEFIQDEKGIGSASRLNMIIGVMVGSFTIIWLTVKGDLGGEIFGNTVNTAGAGHVDNKNITAKIAFNS